MTFKLYESKFITIWTLKDIIFITKYRIIEKEKTREEKEGSLRCAFHRSNIY
jgi:hypothetical protein